MLTTPARPAAYTNVEAGKVRVGDQAVPFTIERPARRSTNAVAVLLPGWMSDQVSLAGARHLIAQRRKQTAVTLEHPRFSWGTVLSNPDRIRTRNVLAVLGVLHQQDTRAPFYLLAHSKAGSDAVHAVDANLRRPVGDQLPIAAEGFMAAVGLDGAVVPLKDMADILAQLRSQRDVPKELGRRAMEMFLSNPARAVQEGISAYMADNRAARARHWSLGLSIETDYYELDTVVHPPHEALNVTIHENAGHFAPFTHPEVVADIAERLHAGAVIRTE